MKPFKVSSFKMFKLLPFGRLSINDLFGLLNIDVIQQESLRSSHEWLCMSLPK